MVPGCSRCVSVLSSCRKLIASRFSRPPYRLGIHCPSLARVVEVEHRGDRVDAKAVDVILVQPEQRVREQEAPHLVAPVVEDQRPPVLVLPLPRVGVLVQRGAVEAGQAVLVLGKVAGHPVEDDADAGAVTGIDEVFEVFGRAEPAGRREEAEHLVAPRSRKRMLHDRQQLDVREPELLHVGNEPRGELAIGEKAVAVLRHASPRAEVHLVSRQRPVAASRPAAAWRHPLAVVPGVPGDVADHRRRLRRRLEGHAEWIAFLQQRAGARADLELVSFAVGQFGDEELPDAGRNQPTHRMRSSVPAVEIADDADAVGVRRPHREMHADRRARVHAMRAQLLVGAIVRALGEEVQIEVAQDPAVAIRIVNLDARGRRRT